MYGYILNSYLRFAEDCDFKDKYMTCNLCLEVIECDFLDQHVLEPTCQS